MKQKNITAAFGWTILEFAIAIPVLFSAGVATYDVARVFQGKTALKAAAEATLRCMVTAKGNCVAEAANTITAQAQYLVQTTEETPIISIPMIHYHGKATTTQAPTYLLTKDANKIIALRKRSPQFLEMIDSVTYPDTLHVNGYLRDFVQISGPSPRSPIFTDSNGKTFLPQFSDKYNITVREGEQKTVQIKIPTYAAIPSQDDCALFATLHDNTPTQCGDFPWRTGTIMGNDSAPWTVSDTTKKNELTEVTYAVIYIEGTSTGTSKEVEAKALLGLSRTDTSQGLPLSLDLGGQYFKGPSFNANFYARGAHTSWISGAIAEASNGELPYEMAHYQAIAVHPGETISLKFSVQRESAPVKNTSLLWKLGSVKIYLPKYQSIAQDVDCKSKSSCDSVCHLSTYGLSDKPLSILNKTSTTGRCSTATLPAAINANANSCHITTFKEDAANLCPTTAEEELACNNLVYTQKDIDPLVIAKSECGVSSDSALRSVRMDTATLHKTLSIKNCDELPLNEPPEWAALEGNFSYEVTGYETVPYDPLCSNFSPSVTTFEGCKADVSKNISGLFSTPQRQQTKIPYETLKAEALACGMDTLAHFDVSFTATGNDEVLSPSTITNAHDLSTTVFSPSVKQTTISLGTYPLGELPELCKTMPCTVTELPSTTSGVTITDVNRDVALSVAKSTLKTYFPNAEIRSDCNEAGDCFEITINSTKEPLSVAIRGRTSTITSSVVGSFPINYEQHQYSERYMSE